MQALYHHRTQGRDVEAVHILGLIGGLEQLGFRVEIVAPPGVETGAASPTPTGTQAGDARPSAWSRIAKGVPQIAFEALEIGYNVVAIPRLWKRVRARRPELIYERYALYNAAGVVVGRLTGTPVVIEVNDTAHVDRTRQGKSLVMPWLAAWVERQVFRNATGLVTVSGYLRDQVLDMGVPRERVRVTPNAVDAQWFDPERVDGAAARERLGLPGKTIIGFAGSFAKWHGPDLLVRAFAELASEFPEARLLMVGDGARRGEAEALARELGVADRTVFTGRVPHSAIPEYVAAMDIGVMPASNVFGSPMKVFEYMAMGKPPVAPRYGPLEEAIEPGTGLLFEPGSVASLAACLRELAAAPEKRRDLGEAARRKIVEQHQWIHNAQAVVDLVERSQSRTGQAVADCGV